MISRPVGRFFDSLTYDDVFLVPSENADFDAFLALKKGLDRNATLYRMGSPENNPVVQSRVERWRSIANYHLALDSGVGSMR
jgi:hypothetical protein